ncbi:MAG: hypothetical protein IPM45_10685 [Acidimicrobiales bacterium]|nr:hypothetical protein [Acidimicrobiales bacterium]
MNPAGRRDPQGKRALFEAPVDVAPDVLAGRLGEGKTVLFSTGPRRQGTVVVECDACGARARLALVDLGMRMLPVTLWLPVRRHAHWLRCPTCERRSWCRIGWDE